MRIHFRYAMRDGLPARRGRLLQTSVGGGLHPPDSGCSIAGGYKTRPYTAACHDLGVHLSFETISEVPGYSQ